ncbi:hypothetical protein BC940DRAFT_275174, partial [Gongronella butleri]
HTHLIPPFFSLVFFHTPIYTPLSLTFCILVLQCNPLVHLLICARFSSTSTATFQAPWVISLERQIF